MPLLLRFAPLAAVAVVCLSTLALAAPRVWKDSSGKFEVEAELVAAEGDSVTLRRTNGKEITVPRKRLSEEDQAYLRQVSPGGGGGDESANREAGKAIAKLAEAFFADLRTKERTEATGLLTAEAQKLAGSGKSPLMGLPTPDKRKNAIRVRAVEIERGTATAPVSVRVNRQAVSTKLHFRKEEGRWAVFAISAVLPGGEKTIDFEVEPGKEREVDPLQSLVGKPMPLQGLMLNGRAFDIRQFEGKVVLVDFWATWCGPCRAEMPNIAANYKKYHDRGFEVVAVSLDRDMSALRDFVSEEQPPWVVLADRHPRNRKSMSAQYRIRGIPALALIGPDGRVVAAHCRGKRLGPAIEKALAATGAEGGSGKKRTAARADATDRR